MNFISYHHLRNLWEDEGFVHFDIILSFSIFAFAQFFKGKNNTFYIILCHVHFINLYKAIISKPLISCERKNKTEALYSFVSQMHWGKTEHCRSILSNEFMNKSVNCLNLWKYKNHRLNCRSQTGHKNLDKQWQGSAELGSTMADKFILDCMKTFDFVDHL